MMIPGIGHVVVLGYLATMVVSAAEGAIVVGGLSALGAALYSSGIPKDSVIAYETAVKSDQFLVMAHGPAEKMGAPRRSWERGILRELMSMKVQRNRHSTCRRSRF